MCVHLTLQTHLISNDGYTSVVKIEPTPCMMPHPQTHGPPVETYTPTHHWPTTHQIPATPNEYPLVPNVPQQTQPYSTLRIKTEPTDFSVVSQLRPRTSSFYTPAVKSKLSTPLLDGRLPSASWEPSMEERKMSKSALKVKRKVKRSVESKVLRRNARKARYRQEQLLQPQEDRRLNSKVSGLCSYYRNDPYSILQIILDHYTHEKIIEVYVAVVPTSNMKSYVKLLVRNGLLKFNLTIPSAMEPGASGTSGPSHTPQIPVTQNEYPPVPNALQQTQPLSTSQIKTEPVEASVTLQRATDPHTLTPSQLPTHTLPTTSFFTPAVKSELSTPLLDRSLPPASWEPIMEEEKMTKSAKRKAKRRLKLEQEDEWLQKTQEARDLIKKKLLKQQETSKLKVKVVNLCSQNKDNPHKILQIFLEHYTHEKILFYLTIKCKMRPYIQLLIEKGLLALHLTIPSAMDTNQPGPSDTSVPPVTRSHGWSTNQPGPSSTSIPVTRSHGWSGNDAQESSCNVVKIEFPLAERYEL